MRFAQVLLLASLASAASAQTFEQLGFLRLNDTTPKSARVVALGETTDALEGSIGDASLNPATLTSIKRASFLVQGARNSLTYNQYRINDDNLPSVSSSWMTSSSLSQLSAAFPLKNGVASFYYASEPDLNAYAPTVNGFGTTPYEAPQCPHGCQYLLPVATLGFERSEHRYGVAYGWEHGSVAIGAGLEWRQIDERSNVARAVFGLPTPPQTPTNELLVRRINDSAVIPNVGLRWTATPRVAVSAAYNGGGSYTRTTSACNIDGFQWTECASSLSEIGRSNVKMPDAFRAGAAFSATSRLRLTAEAVRRNYSTFAVDRYSIFGTEQVLPYRDVTELHGGVEYRFPVVALRAGYWSDPSRYVSQFVAAGQTVHHYTVGAGFNVGSARIDAAYEDADVNLQRRALLSVAFGM